MRVFTTKAFNIAYARLDTKMQQAVRRTIALMKRKSDDPSLRVMPVGVLVACAMLAQQAMAAEMPRAPEKPALADTAPFGVSQADCQRLVEAGAFAGGRGTRSRKPVSATYQAGVDVRGNAVVGADPDGGFAPDDLLPERLEFSISLDLMKYMQPAQGPSAEGLSAADLLDHYSGRVAKTPYDADHRAVTAGQNLIAVVYEPTSGRMRFNGKDIGSDLLADIRHACDD